MDIVVWQNTPDFYGGVRFRVRRGYLRVYKGVKCIAVYAPGKWNCVVPWKKRESDDG
jgi:hypothetical protein